MMVYTAARMQQKQRGALHLSMPLALNHPNGAKIITLSRCWYADNKSQSGLVLFLSILLQF